MAPADPRDTGTGARDASTAPHGTSTAAHDTGAAARDTRRATRADVGIAAITALVAIGLMLALPPLDAADPDGTGTVYPTPGGVVWNLLALGLLAQSAVLLAARRAPRTTLVVVAAIPV